MKSTGEHNLRLEGQTIYLRPVRLSDANERYLGWINDKKVTKGLETKSADLQSLKEYVSNVLDGQHNHFFAICMLENDLHVGNIKLDQLDLKAATCELGIMVGDKSYWGQKVGRQACELAIHYAFSHLKLRKILLAVYASNTAAYSLYEKLGFKEEGCLKKHVLVDGELVDKYFMCLYNKLYAQ